MKLTTFLASIIALTTLTPSCTSLPANCGDDRIHKGDDRYCEIPRIATNFYREHVFYNVYTYPEIFFYWLPKESKRDTINVLALGDSWFAYPKSNWLYLDIFTPPANALTHLAKLEHPSSYILSLSNAGELVTNIAGLARQDALELSQSVQQKYSIPWATVRALRRMKDKTVTSNSFDYILISGGGNDFFASRIRSVLGKPPCATPQEALSCINEKELNQIIDRLREAYVTLITTIRSEPGYEQARIVTHTYDKIYPMPIGAKMFYGLVEVGEYGWFYPVLEEFGITDKDQQRAITNRFLGKFQDMLLGLERTHSTRRTLW